MIIHGRSEEMNAWLVAQPDLIVASDIDRATYEQPGQYSAGIHFVLVNGTPLIDHGKLIEGIYPGKPILAK